MANLQEPETITTQRCGELAGLPIAIVVTEETSFIRIGDQPALSIGQWFEVQNRVVAGMLKLSKLRR